MWVGAARDDLARPPALRARASTPGPARPSAPPVRDRLGSDVGRLESARWKWRCATARHQAPRLMGNSTQPAGAATFERRLKASLAGTGGRERSRGAGVLDRQRDRPPLPVPEVEHAGCSILPPVRRAAVRSPSRPAPRCRAGDRARARRPAAGAVELLAEQVGPAGSPGAGGRGRFRAGRLLARRRGIVREQPGRGRGRAARWPSRRGRRRASPRRRGRERLASVHCAPPLQRRQLLGGRRGLQARSPRRDRRRRSPAAW